MFTIISITPQMSLGDAVQRYLKHLKTLVSLNKYSESGRYGRAYTLGFLGPLAAVRLRDLSRSQIVTWRDALPMMRGRRGARLISLQHNALTSLGAFFTWCAERCDALVNLPLLTRRIKGEYQSLPQRTLDWGDYQSLRTMLAQLDREPTGRPQMQTLRVSIRLLRVLADNGSRMCEVRNATVAQFDRARGALILPCGKNRKPRVVVLSPLSIEICEQQRQQVRSGLLFPSPITGKAISHQALNRALVRIARTAGVRAPHELSAHGLRRTFAEHAYEAGFSFEELASSLGNSPPVVKRFYVQAAVSPAARRINAFINRGDRGDGRSNA